MGGRAASAGTATVRSPLELAQEANSVVNVQNQGQLGQQQQYGAGFDQAYLDTLRQTMPEVYGIQQGLAHQIYGRVSNPNAVSPDLMGQFDENIRAAQAQRGFGLGGEDVFAHALARSGFLEQTAQQNLGMAQNYLNQYRGPSSFVTNVGTPQALSGAQNLVNQQDQARMQQEIAASQSAGRAGWGGALGSVAGAGLGFALGGPMGAAYGMNLGGQLGGAAGGGGGGGQTNPYTFNFNTTAAGKKEGV